MLSRSQATYTNYFVRPSICLRIRPNHRHTEEEGDYIRPPPSEFLFFPWPLYLYALFLSIGSDELMTPLPSPPPSVKNVKIRENSEKIRGPRLAGPVVTLYNSF